MIKNFIANSFFYISTPFTALSKGLAFIASSLILTGGRIHMYFNTETGKRLKEIEKQTRETIRKLQEAQERLGLSNKNSLTSSNKNVNFDGTNKLFNIIKGNNNAKK